MSRERVDRLGRFQLRLLLLLQMRPMYGLELMKILKARGKEKLSPGLLYPTLNRLEERQLLESREEKKKGSGATRKIYQTTAQGLEAIFKGLGPIPEFIDYLLWEESAEARANIYRECGFKEGDVVVDFSNNLEDIIAIDIGDHVGQVGKVYFQVFDPEQVDILQNHIIEHNLENIVIPLDSSITNSLNPASADIATNIMSLHEEENPLNCIKAMRDIVKEKGTVVVADIHKIDHIFSNLLHRLAPHHKRMGFTEEELVNLYVKAGLVILRVQKEKGIITLVGLRP